MSTLLRIRCSCRVVGCGEHNLLLSDQPNGLTICNGGRIYRRTCRNSDNGGFLCSRAAGKGSRKFCRPPTPPQFRPGQAVPKTPRDGACSERDEPHTNMKGKDWVRCGTLVGIQNERCCTRATGMSLWASHRLPPAEKKSMHPSHLVEAADVRVNRVSQAGKYAGKDC